MPRSRVSSWRACQLDPVFERAVARRGGSLSPTIYEGQQHFAAERFKQLFDEAITNVVSLAEWIAEEVPDARAMLKRVRFGYVCNPIPQAFVEKYSDYYIIGVHSGLVDVITQSSFTLFSTREAFPGIGDPRGPDPWIPGEVRTQYPSIKAQPFDTDQVAGSGFNIKGIQSREGGGYQFPNFPFPITQEREFAAHLMACYAIEFSFLHELGHLLAGHLTQFSNLSSFDDGPISPPTHLSSDDRHTLEIDADAMAIQLAAAGGLIAPLPWRGPTFENIFRHISPDDLPLNADELGLSDGVFGREGLCHLWCAASGLLMLLFSQQEIPIADWQSGSHPHPLYRALNVFSVLESSTIAGDPLFADARKVWVQALRDLMDGWRVYGIPGMKLLEFGEGDITRLFQWLDDLCDRTVHNPNGIIKRMERNGSRAPGTSFYRRLIRDAPDGLRRR